MNPLNAKRLKEARSITGELMSILFNLQDMAINSKGLAEAAAAVQLVRKKIKRFEKKSGKNPFSDDWQELSETILKAIQGHPDSHLADSGIPESLALKGAVEAGKMIENMDRLTSVITRPDSNEYTLVSAFEFLKNAKQVIEASEDNLKNSPIFVELQRSFKRAQQAVQSGSVSSIQTQNKGGSTG